MTTLHIKEKTSVWSVVSNSFTSVVVRVKHSCTGRRPSQVICALTGHSRHSSATLQMWVFSALKQKPWQENYSSDRDTRHKEKSFVMLFLKTSWNVFHEKLTKSTKWHYELLHARLVICHKSITEDTVCQVNLKTQLCNETLHQCGFALVGRAILNFSSV